MPAPLSPPPANDTGALTFPRTLQAWLDVNPITKLDRCGVSIALPTFSVAVNWLGYSDIVLAVNYEINNNFSLKAINNNNAEVTPINYKYISIPGTGGGVTISGSGDAIGNG